MSVTARYLRDQNRAPNASLGFGSLLAGFVYEKSDNLEEARRYYDDAHLARAETSIASATSELLVIVGWGRVPHRIAHHIPVGLAMTRTSGLLSALDEKTAAHVAAHGLLTWVNYPTLAPAIPLACAPSIVVDGRRVALDATLDVTAEVQAEWNELEGSVMAAALSRAATRAAVGLAIDGIASTSDNENIRPPASSSLCSPRSR